MSRNVPAPEPAEAPAAMPAAAPAQIAPKFPIDLSHASVGDLPLIHRMRANEAMDAEIVELFDRIIAGGAKAVPLPQLGQAIGQVLSAVFSAANPEGDGGN